MAWMKLWLAQDHYGQIIPPKSFIEQVYHGVESRLSPELMLCIFKNLLFFMFFRKRQCQLHTVPSVTPSSLRWLLNGSLLKRSLIMPAKGSLRYFYSSTLLLCSSDNFQRGSKINALPKQCRKSAEPNRR